MNTPNSPRSGIVPPDVMATTRASRRPAISPVSRSQVSRGLSSANSSDGYAPASIPRPPSTASRQAAGDRRRRLDLDDEIHRAHVDPELQAGRGDEGRHAAGLEVLLDGQPLLAGDRAVVGPDQVLAGQLVEPLRQALGEAA